MRRWIPAVILSLSATFATTSSALAPGDAARGFREGANHHVGDDSFKEEFGRAPGPSDTEALRMHVHFTHVRRWLADRPPTKPELAARRQEILGHFDEYIAKGTTPLNVHVPWRSPVFIDDHGTICAVGYLIEKTAGRPLAEKIAREHRYNVLEDIAAAMPEVKAWVDTSGLTLEELASIQPGYIPPVTWNEPDFADDAIDFTPITLEVSDAAGTWRSRYPTGERLAEGRYEGKQPAGEWRFYYPSGNLAAKGDFAFGRRDGRWTFFHDSKEGTRMSSGSFMNGMLIEEWRHFDESGKLVARTRPESPWKFGGAGYLMEVLPHGDEHVHHWVHQATVAGMKHRLDYLADGLEQIYVRDGGDEAFDAHGEKLTRADGGWQSSDCHWGHTRKAMARAGDVVTLNGIGLAPDDEKCSAGVRVPAARAKRLDAIMAGVGPHIADGTSAAPLAPLQSFTEEIRSRLVTVAVRPRVTPAVDAQAATPTLATR